MDYGRLPRTHILRRPDVLGQVSSILDLEHVTRAMQDQRGNANRRENVTDIDVAPHNHYGPDRRRASARSFQSSNKSAELFVTSQAWHEYIKRIALSPTPFPRFH
jgi:hypothetical protein